MKEALIVANLAGFASFLLSDIDILQDMGYRITYASNTDTLPWEDTKAQLEKRDVRIVPVDFDSKNPLSKQNFKAYGQLKKIIKETKFDIIHCHTPIAGLLTRMVANPLRKKGTAVLYTTHGFSFTTRSSWKTKLVYETIEKFGATMSDAIITINQEDFAAAKKMGSKKVYYIHGVGVDIDKYANATVDRQEYRKKLGVENDEIMVLSVGELSDRKNHQVIIDALSKIESDKKYVYVICGNGINGGTGKMLQEKAEKLGVRLLLLGFRDDIPEIIKCSDVGAIPSVREGLGLAGIQSLAAGVPLVGTDVQGIRDYIVPDETGYLCNADDAEAFAMAMEKLAALSDEEKQNWRKRCVAQAKAFDMDVSAQERFHIYTQFN